MIFILLVILLFICIGCYIEGKTERKGLKLVLSISLAIMLSFMMEATLHSLVENEIMEGMLALISYYALPIITFGIFQLLLYEIRMFE
ncbi:hypothetical protein [Pontibacillus marinus]|uniref:Uncharacterized protein n=1 Tax=Pontibacillus marinus BH030004 = DSM 16465 TaxID=1385511 RepID=A0A0A5G397_9BACI|nr:hypothetical protein [Pontibacillus marinus]KGX85613.1 hypothetical protein N783_14055 [Pontibacillus marinus BH030004 = DSM 16465]